MGRLCYPTRAPLQSCPGRLQSGPGARRVWHVFLPSWYKFYRSLACRGRKLNEAGKLSRYCYFVNSTGAVSRYKVDRSQRIVTVYRIYFVCNGARPGAGFGRICLGSRVCKNRDKRLTHIVRVSC
jgi:hypothetical protein